MSEMFRTPEKRLGRNRVTSYMHRSSTPYRNIFLKQHYSISLSEIGTGSSSSAKEVKKKPLPERTLEKRKKNIDKKTKKKRRRDLIRLTRLTRLPDSDSEWETRSEKSVRTLVDSQKFSPKNIHEECQNDASVCRNLFEDPCTPEKVRDAPIAHELFHESPILQSSRRLHLIPVKDNLVQREELLPVSNLQFSRSQEVNPEETDDDAPIFHHERDMKTYSAPLICKKNPEQRPRNFTFRARYPTAMSNLLWDEFVDKFHDEIAQYLASPKRASFDPLPSGIKCVSVHYDRAKRKWITNSDSDKENICQPQKKPKTNRRGTKVRGRNGQKRGRKPERKEAALKSVQKQTEFNTVYDQFSETDIEFETGNPDKKCISFREFCCRQRMNKTKTPQTSSHSDTQ